MWYKVMKPRILYGQDYFYETLLGLRFKISTFSFFQPNSLAAEVLYSIVREYIGETKDKEVFDLYSGTGTIAQLLSSGGKRGDWCGDCGRSCGGSQGKCRH